MVVLSPWGVAGSHGTGFLSGQLSIWFQASNKGGLRQSHEVKGGTGYV